VEAFGLPTRLVAKTFLFRLIFGGTCYSYAGDPDFTHVSTSTKYWQTAIDKFKDKYRGWDKWWALLMQEASTTGHIVNPYTGRTYEYERNWRGDWPETTIKNYIVQGFAADLMAIARVSFYRRFIDMGISGVLVNTVHDSIVVDVPDYEVERVVQLFHEVFRDLPKNFERVFKKPFDLPLRCECAVGRNMSDIEEVKYEAV
jgi:DNA polymerase I-like protein with 3'-5' exonuclease and polymerase domains